MSETFTKTCERPSCDNGKRYTLDHNGIIIAVADCPDCSCTGRVPDVEATLRAEVARLTAEVERLEGREREAATLFRSPDPWRPEKCGAHYDAVSAWLAGCKS